MEHEQETEQEIGAGSRIGRGTAIGAGIGRNRNNNSNRIGIAIENSNRNNNSNRYRNMDTNTDTDNHGMAAPEQEGQVGKHMARTVGIGIQDFGKLIENHLFYVDKTAFIKEWWESGDDVTLITRPRRFGKTVTMSMLDYFFSNQHEGTAGLFEGLDVFKEEKYRQLQGTYPVIFLSFAGVKGVTYVSTKKQMNKLLANLYNKYDINLKKL